ncbi:hypothetical protein [Anaerosacchariphilus polymeriproducens]|uniref:hypothetical protein n=1 Tax=Anaerosacchariphilus polymeriproducens TaxID=1812858 RepID=UPI0011C06D6D|nr:hypothetical protein [Anaerosacchariphilus polymeriproducens]
MIKSIQHMTDKVSKQTVKNKIHKLNFPLEAQQPKTKKQIPTFILMQMKIMLHYNIYRKRETSKEPERIPGCKNWHMYMKG